MTYDPREFPDNYPHSFSGSLGKYDQLLAEYDVEIKYLLEREGERCNVKLCYFKEMEDGSSHLTPFGNFPIRDISSLTTDSLHAVIKMGIEGIFNCDDS